MMRHRADEPSADAPEAESERDPQVFRILTVCTGNICRSPQAEQLLRARLPSALGIDAALLEVTSAGTMAWDGDPMDPPAAAQAARLGIADTAAHRARRLRPEQLARADLVLALAVEHRGAAARALPQAMPRSFTLIEFAASVEALAAGGVTQRPAPLGDDGPAAFLRRAVTAARTARALLPPSAVRRLDIDDPYRRSTSVYKRSADAVAEQVDRVASALAALARG